VTPATFRTIRQRHGLTIRKLADTLRIEDESTIRRYERGDRKISGPVSLLMELLDSGQWTP
jgi:transcriptional regulator with XRE-family HTH domain